MGKKNLQIVFVSISIIGIIGISISACNRITIQELPKVATDKVKISKRLLPMQNVLFYEDGKICVYDDNAKRVHELFKVKNLDARLGFAKYYSDANKVVYEIETDNNGTLTSELRVYSIEKNKDDLIDNDAQVIASDNSRLTLYTIASGSKKGGLWLYDIDRGKQFINVRNAGTGMLNKESTELFHHTYISSQGPINQPQALCITDLKSGQQVMIAKERLSTDLMPVSVSERYAVYYEGLGESGIGNLYRFDRSTKKNSLLSNNIDCFAIPKGKEGIVAVKVSNKKAESIQVIEITKNATKTKIVYSQKPSALYDSYYHSFLAPASFTIISTNSPNDLNLYNYKTQQSRAILGKNEVAMDYHLSPSQMELFVIIDTMNEMNADQFEEGLYKIELKTGNSSLVHKVPKSKNPIAQTQILDIF